VQSQVRFNQVPEKLPEKVPGGNWQHCRHLSGSSAVWRLAAPCLAGRLSRPLASWSAPSAARLLRRTGAQPTARCSPPGRSAPPPKRGCCRGAPSPGPRPLRGGLSPRSPTGRRRPRRRPGGCGCLSVALCLCLCSLCVLSVFSLCSLCLSVSLSLSSSPSSYLLLHPAALLGGLCFQNSRCVALLLTFKRARVQLFRGVDFFGY
jgi:hypothetical protein